MDMGDRINILSFPGLGIGEFEVHTVAFTIFGRPVAWYGIIITLGIIAAFFYCRYRASQEQVSIDDLMDYAIFCVISAVICARIYYVATTWTELSYYVPGDFFKTLRNVIAIWEGGIAIYGAIIGGALAAYVVSRVKHIKFTKVADLLSPGVMIGQIAGRWGNFINAEAHGGVTDLPWRMGITTAQGTVYYHPAFLYESLWNLIGFLMINAFYKKKKYDGQIFLMYLTWYGFGRMLIEGLRTDSLYVGPFRISQIVGFVSFLAGAVMLLAFGIAARKNGWKPESLGQSASGTAVSAGKPSGKHASPEKKDTASGSAAGRKTVGVHEGSVQEASCTKEDVRSTGNSRESDSVRGNAGADNGSAAQDDGSAACRKESDEEMAEGKKPD